MADSLRDLSDEALRSLSRQCSETISAVCHRLSNDASLEPGVRRLMPSDDLLAELAEIEQENRELASNSLHRGTGDAGQLAKPAGDRGGKRSTNSIKFMPCPQNLRVCVRGMARLTPEFAVFPR